MWRRFRIVVVLLFAGGVVNVVVAFACVLVHGRVFQEWRPVRNPRHQEPSEQSVAAPTEPAARAASSEEPRFVLATQRLGHEIVSSGGGRADARAGLHGAVHYRGRAWWPDEVVRGGRGDDYAVASGWPFLALSAWCTNNLAVPTGGVPQFVPLHHWGAPVDVGTLETLPLVPKVGIRMVGDRRFQIPVILPFRPVWPGFVANTVLYAGALWIFFKLLGVLRARCRIWRGTCPRCRYPRGESSVCPECGAAVMPLVTSAPTGEWHALREKGPES